jgi:hypothetical protein
VQESSGQARTARQVKQELNTFLDNLAQTTGTLPASVFDFRLIPPS